MWQQATQKQHTSRRSHVGALHEAETQDAGCHHHAEVLQRDCAVRSPAAEPAVVDAEPEGVLQLLPGRSGQPHCARGLTARCQLEAVPVVLQSRIHKSQQLRSQVWQAERLALRACVERPSKLAQLCPVGKRKDLSTLTSGLDSDWRRR